jgi:phosphoenolpyruvate-protein kinase (PTS system EI component)
MAGDRTINTGGGNYIENVSGNYIQNYHAAEQRQTLAQAAKEISELLQQLSQTYSTTDAAMLTALHQEIQHNPTLKARLVNALKAGGLEALKAIFNHPAFSIPAETVKGWLEAE